MTLWQNDNSPTVEWREGYCLSDVMSLETFLCYTTLTRTSLGQQYSY